ncbi:electron transfer flavoprotein subunit beta/FixA family protein [Calderihabitans maritimus]|uniref:Electron transfer flavoprotein subunit beta n=1 Tax=Calderihabitans maritimus TaxID=1246530 RepID=A0A1Z5HUC0_9FIRM|nr:electron transfer flavoprotein subunit beta/FixA family protein [Calderihabitans maritimus]GAW93112.1 electron transfer flavoprotein, beta subunit [Calderihabitans maritimus]
MKIIVCLKQTFDTEAKIQLTDDGKISDEGVSLIINPYDEFAVEEALKIKENMGGEVVVVSIGKERAQEAIRQALAMGADRGILITDEALEGGDEYTTATVLAKVIGNMEYDLILCGNKAIDDQSSQVAVRLAEKLGLPQINVVTKLEVSDGKVVGHREIEGGSEIIEAPLPAVVTAQKGLNEPRYPSMKGIMQARKKELKKLSLQDIGLEPSAVGASGAKVKVLEYSLPAPRKAGKIIEGEPAEAARELVRLLREEAKVI